MDYKYIEELLARYWQCETTAEEETILKNFFSQVSVPQHLQPYAPLFAAEKTLQDAKLTPAFEDKILRHIQPRQTVKARKISLTARLAPLFKAVAAVAIIFMIGHAAQNAFRPANAPDYNYDAYEETYSDVETAYDQMADALLMVSQSLKNSSCDSIAQPASAE